MKNLWLFSLKIAIVTLLMAGGIIYNTTLYEHKKTIDKAFNTTLKLDLSKRKDASPQMKPRRGTLPKAPANTLKEKGILVRTSKDTTFYPYKNEKNRLLMKVDQIAELQTITHYYNPIRPIQLDSIFQATLKQEGWNVQVGITYSDYSKQSHQHSNTDMSIYSSSFHTDIIPLGLNNEMTVQAFVRFHPHWLLQKGGRLMLGIIILWIMLCGVYLFVWLRERRKVAPLPAPVEEVHITLPSDVSPAKGTVKEEKDKKVAIGEYSYDKEKGLLYWGNGQQECIKKRQEYIVLTCLLEAPDYRCEECELLKALGKKADKSYTNSLQSVISRLRKCFEKDPHIQISHIADEYQLITDAPVVDPKDSVISSPHEASSPDSSME